MELLYTTRVILNGGALVSFVTSAGEFHLYLVIIMMMIKHMLTYKCFISVDTFNPNIVIFSLQPTCLIFI
jgi:hypothetical protein